MSAELRRQYFPCISWCFPVPSAQGDIDFCSAVPPSRIPRQAEHTLQPECFLLVSFVTPYLHFTLLHQTLLCFRSLPARCLEASFLFFLTSPVYFFFSLCVSLGSLEPSEGQSLYERLGPAVVETQLILKILTQQHAPYRWNHWEVEMVNLSLLSMHQTVLQVVKRP